MANLIQIKRSLNTATPTSLANGELAYTANGDVLYIGSNGAIEAIGGKRTPGTLTANQALVANSSSAIDKIIVANLQPTGVYANGSLGSAGQVLVSNGTSVYWGTGTTGSNTQVQFNDSGVANATAGFTFDKASNTLFVGNTIQTTNFETSSLTVNSSIVVGNSTVNTVISSNSIAVGSNVAIDTSSITIGNSSVNSAYTSSLISVANSTTSANISSAGFVVGTSVVNSTAITSDDLVVNGNAQLGSNSSDVLSIYATVNTDIMPNANVTYNIGNNTVRWNEIHASNLHSTSGYFDGDVQIGGDLIVTGNVTTVNVSSFSVSDPMIYLAGNNYSSDLVDIGFAGNYHQAGTDKHAGLIRHAADDTFYLFKGTTQELSNTLTVNVADPSFVLADLKAYLLSGGLTTNATNVTITANSTVNVSIVANTLTLSSALAGNSGGTGLSSYTAEDILVANSTNGFRRLALGTSGYVLQSNGTALVYDTLDGGTF